MNNSGRKSSASVAGKSGNTSAPLSGSWSSSTKPTKNSSDAGTTYLVYSTDKSCNSRWAASSRTVTGTGYTRTATEAREKAVPNNTRHTVLPPTGERTKSILHGVVCWSAGPWSVLVGTVVSGKSAKNPKQSSRRNPIVTGKPIKNGDHPRDNSSTYSVAVADDDVDKSSNGTDSLVHTNTGKSDIVEHAVDLVVVRSSAPSKSWEVERKRYYQGK